MQLRGFPQAGRGELIKYFTSREAMSRWRASPRDWVLALLPIYAGLRVSETVALDTDDVRLSARKGNLRVRGNGTTVRDLPIHPQLRTDLQTWLDERPDWPGADTSSALLLNRRGRRLSVRGASDIIRVIAADADLGGSPSTYSPRWMPDARRLDQRGHERGPESAGARGRAGRAANPSSPPAKPRWPAACMTRPAPTAGESGVQPR